MIERHEFVRAILLTELGCHASTVFGVTTGELVMALLKADHALPAREKDRQRFLKRLPNSTHAKEVRAALAVLLTEGCVANLGTDPDAWYRCHPRSP